MMDYLSQILMPHMKGVRRWTIVETLHGLPESHHRFPQMAHPHPLLSLRNPTDIVNWTSLVLSCFYLKAMTRWKLTEGKLYI
jgi:hypothetical protein